MKTIDRDLLIKKYIDIDIAKFNNSDVKIVLENLKQNILKMPSIDSLQGEWIEHEWAEEVEGLLISNYECSECHSWERSISNFCPHCGARMICERKTII